MRTAQYLRDQAARAERLASGMDCITAERLLSLSNEYRLMADQIEHGAPVISAARTVTELSL